ncbi:universal stress protein [Calditrichota bacterium LG25]
MIKSILLPIDGSPYTEAVLDYGDFLAEKFGAILRILTVIDIRLFDWSVATSADSFVPIMPSTEFQEESQRIQNEKAEKVIQKASEILSAKKRTFEIIKVSGIPVDEICQVAKTTDMVIMGIRGEYEKWSGKLLGATTESVTRQIAKPMMLVDKEFKPFEQIYCGYDGTIAANHALEMAAFLAYSLNLPLQVVSVFDSDDEREETLKEAKQYLTPYKIKFDLRHETGDPDETLVNVQNNSPKPSLMVIGGFGHSRLREAILGSTTVHVMRKANKPILLVK